MSLILHGDLASQPMRALMFYFDLIGAKYEINYIDVYKGEHRTADFGKINPFQLVPAITDDGFNLAETSAIMDYIAKTRGDTKYFPGDLKKNAKVHEYFSWHHSNTRPACALYFAALYKRFFPEGYIKVTKEMTFPKFEAFLKKFEELFLTENKFIIGDELTVADLLAFCEIQQNWIFCDYDLKEKGPKKVYEWAERILNTEGLQDLNKVAEKRFEEIVQYRDL